MSEQSQDVAWMDYQRRMDDDNMLLLVILHRVFGGISTLCSCGLMAYFSLAFGVIGIAATHDPKSGSPPAGLIAALSGFWFVIVIFVIGLSLLNFLCANWIRDRRNWTGVVILSVLNFFQVPHGLALGIFTLIVINRQSVRSTFQ